MNDNKTAYAILLFCVAMIAGFVWVNSPSFDSPAFIIMAVFWVLAGAVMIADIRQSPDNEVIYGLIVLPFFIVWGVIAIVALFTAIGSGFSDPAANAKLGASAGGAAALIVFDTICFSIKDKKEKKTGKEKVDISAVDKKVNLNKSVKNEIKNH